MHELMKKTCEALEDIERSDRLNIMNTADRELVAELVDLKKNILKVQKLEDEMEGYSENGGTDYGRGSSYTGGEMNHGHDYSGRRDRRGRYSRNDGRDKMMEYLEKAWDAAPERDREGLKRFMHQLENA